MTPRWLVAVLVAVLVAASCGDPAFDVAAELRGVSGLVVTGHPDAGAAGYQRYDFTLVQAVDHAHPEAGTFTQRATLFHVSDTAPMVLYTGGYGLASNPSLTEVARTFGANQINYEHRYFVASRPTPLDWTKLDIKQAADDAHHLVESLRPLYPGRWLNTGASKGGMTSVYHRRFYPDDVDATLAYVAPSGDSLADPAYNDFLAQVGGAGRAGCRADLQAFERRLLEQRADIEPLVQGTFTLVPLSEAYEITVLELEFVFWQYGHPDDAVLGCAAIPGPGAAPAQMLAFLESHATVDGDAGAGALDYFHAFYHQVAEQLGYPAVSEAPFGGLVQFPGADQPATYLPPGEPRPFDPGAMADIDSWVATAGTQLMFIYGEFDPWSARMFRLGGAQDSHVYVVAGGNHGSNLRLLSAADQDSALATLTRWLGVAPVTPLRSLSRVRAAEPDELGGLRPPL